MSAARHRGLVGAVAGVAMLALLAVVAMSRRSSGVTVSGVRLERNFFFSDSGAVGRVQALASAEAAQGKKSGGVKVLLKKELDKQVHDREAHRYANALKKGGLNVDPAAEKTIMSAFAKSKRGASSLAVDNKLQKQVVLAGAITGKERTIPVHHYRHYARAGARQPVRISDKLTLAEAILSGHSGPTGGRFAGVTDPAAKHAAIQHKKASFKSQMKAQLKQKAKIMEKQGLKALAPKHMARAYKPLKGAFAKDMMAQLNQKEKHMAASVWHRQVKAVTSQDLATARWDSARQWATKEEGSGGKMAVDTTLYSKPGHAKPQLTVGSSSDATKISVTSGADKNRQQLELMMEKELNEKASKIERRNFDKIAEKSMPKKDHHKETDLVDLEAAKAASGFSREKLEKTLEQSIHQIDDSTAESLYHQGLISEKFDGAIVS